MQVYTNRIMSLPDNETGNLIIDKINEYGFCALLSEMEHEGKSIQFSYTIGLAKHDLPELIIFGLTPYEASNLFYDVARMMDSDDFKLRDGMIITNVRKIPFALKYATRRGSEVSRYVIDPGGDCYQIVVPDAENKFPWDAGFNRLMMNSFQPYLWDTIH